MRAKFFLSVVGGLGLGLLMGCVSNIDGRKQPGVSFSKSVTEARYNVKPKEVWEAAKDVLNHLGRVTTDDPMRSVMEATVDSRNVWVKVEPLGDNLTQVTVQARSSSGGGDKTLAEYIDKQIAVRLASGKPLSAILPKP